MFPRLHLRRSTLRRLLRALLLLTALLTLIDLISLSTLRSSIPPPSPLIQPRPAYTGPPILLASTHWNNAGILSSNWTSSVLSLAAYLGPSKIFVSIVEGGSWDNSGEILRDLDRRLGELGVGRVVKTGGRSHKEEMERPIGVGWVDTRRGGKELRRVPYLAGVRNEVLKVVVEGVGMQGGGKAKEERAAVEKAEVERVEGQGQDVRKGKTGKEGLKRKPKGRKAGSVEPENGKDPPEQQEQVQTKEGGWDWNKLGRIVWINDVVFTVDDVLNLLNTRDGDYAAACSMDYSKPPAYYDTFALRDIEGYEAVSSTFPYFRSRGSRDAMVAGQPVPVQSCWNGMVSFDASPFTTLDPLSFRGIRDSLAALHLEASECCLIHIDNPLTPSKGVWLNPNVRVGYNPAAYDAIHRTTPWPPLSEAWRGVWRNRITRWTTTEWFKWRTVRKRVEEWGREGDKSRFEAGEVCLINEMQVLVENGWAHV